MKQNKDFKLRKMYTIKEEMLSEGGQDAEKPLKKVAAIAVISNPYVGKYQEDLGEAMAFGAQLGEKLGDKAVEALGEPVESYGKGGIVGINGEQEHAVAFITSTFGNKVREAVGGGEAWLSSASKRAAAGTPIDIPLAYKDAIWVRSHYDAMEVRVPDAPGPDEIMIIFVVANRGRLNERLGGLKKDDAIGDGVK